MDLVRNVTISYVQYSNLVCTDSKGIMYHVPFGDVSPCNKNKVNNEVCRVDFDEAWIRTFDDDAFEQGPYPNIESVPDGIAKTLIRNIGKALFIEPFAVFPVSYLDNELIVFDFELLGTRICARKQT